MKLRPAQLMPFVITAVVLVMAVGLHVVSRNLATAALQAEKKDRKQVFLEQLEWLSYDTRVKIGAAYHDQSGVANNLAAVFFDDIAFAKVNDGSYSQYYAPVKHHEDALQLYPRRWPWPRFIHGQLVRELAAEGATAIGFDVMFPELAKVDEAENVEDPEEGVLSSDEFFAQQMRKTGKVILGVEGENLPAPMFLTNAAGLGSIAARPDYAVLRRVKPFETVTIWHPMIRERVKPLGLMLHLARTNEPGRIVIPMHDVENPEAAYEIPIHPNGAMKMTEDGEIAAVGDEFDEDRQSEFPFTRKRAWNLGIALAAQALNLDLENAELQQARIILRGPEGLTRSIPLDDAGFMLINWSLRYEDIKDGKTPVYFGQLGEVLINDWGRTRGGEDLGSRFKDRIVLIGSVATGNDVSDVGATPLESQTRLVTKHLNIANSILMDRFVERTSLPVEAALIFVLGCISALVTWRMRVVFAGLAIGGLATCYLLFTVWMYVDYRYWIPLVMPLAGGFLLPHFSLVTYRVVFEERERRRVRSIFSKIVSPDVVQELLSAEKLSLGGARRKITVYFADVRGFTEYTDASQDQVEAHVQKHNLNEEEKNRLFDEKAAETLSTVNLYLSVIADMIKKHKGTLDKYMGDCVMAFWGAPVANEQHAVDCVRAAIDSQRAIYEMNQQRAAENERRKQQNEALVAAGKEPMPLLPLLTLGSGINSGYAIVGLMGSDATILNYTVFGREVNLASRLEGASGRGRIFIGEATYLELKRYDAELAATCIPQTPIIPKGFRQPIPIYEVPWKIAAPPSSPKDSASEAPAAVSAAGN